MAQYTEDKLSALDIAKDVGFAAINPLTQYQYGPEMWKVRQAGIRLPTKNILWNNPVVGVTRAVMLRMAAKKHGVTVQQLKHGKKMKKNARLTAFKDTVSKFGLEYTDDNVLRLSTKRIRDQDWFKASKQKELELNEFKDSINKKIAQRQKLLVKFGRKNYRREQFLRKNSQHLSDVAKAKLREDTLKTAENIKKLTGDIKELRDPMTRRMANAMIAGSKMGRYGKTLGMAALHGGVRLGLIAGKFGAAVALGSLIYEGVKMVTNPIAQAGVQSIDNAFNKLSQLSKPELGGSLNMGFTSYGAATERQMAVQAISRSRINGRSMLGSEAQYMHN